MSTYVISLLWRTGAILIISPQKIDSNLYFAQKLSCLQSSSSRRQRKYNRKYIFNTQHFTPAMLPVFIYLFIYFLISTPKMKLSSRTSISFSLQKGEIIHKIYTQNQQQTQVGRVCSYFSIYKLLFYHFLKNSSANTDVCGANFSENVMFFPDTFFKRK